MIIIVSGALVSSYQSHYIRKSFLADQGLEFLWTVCPVFVLISLALPSLGILFILEDLSRCVFRVKVTGNQWFWEYENREFRIQNNEVFRSYISPLTDSREKSLFRLLDCSSSLILPVDTNVRLLVSSADVLHSWTVPALGVKVDACPGRLNELLIRASRTGIFYGQCSEICGANHSFIPISVKIVKGDFWLR